MNTCDPEAVDTTENIIAVCDAFPSKTPKFKSVTIEGISEAAINDNKNRDPYVPEVGDYALSDLKRSHVRDWCTKQTFSNKRMTNVLSVLRAALAEAVQDELVETNVLYGWTYQRNEPPSPDDDVDPFSADEQRGSSTHSARVKSGTCSSSPSGRGCARPS